MSHEYPIDPILHSFVTDSLPPSHPLAQESVGCDRCAKGIHGLPNETMSTWVETAVGNYCLPCFVVVNEASRDAHEFRAPAGYVITYCGEETDQWGT